MLTEGKYDNVGITMLRTISNIGMWKKNNTYVVILFAFTPWSSGDLLEVKSVREVLKTLSGK